MLIVSFLAFAFEGKWDGNLIILTTSQLVSLGSNVPARGSAETSLQVVILSHHRNWSPFWPKLAKTGQNGLCAQCAFAQPHARKSWGVICFIPGPELKFPGLRIIHIGPTIAKKSVENWFPIEMINLKTAAQTPVRAEKFQGIKDDSMWT